MADSGSRVLLLDADMRRPSIHRIFKLPNEAGLSSLVVGGCSLEDTIKATDFPRLSALVCGPIPPNPSELLHTKTFAALLRSLEEKFDRIVIDSPPVGIVADPVVISTLVDGTVMVVKAGYTSREQAKQSIETLKRVKARLFGAVLNDLDIESREYDYYYYKQYGYYYTTPKDEALS
jgi:capsular exopolysaccharide synthesis family protein